MKSLPRLFAVLAVFLAAWSSQANAQEYQASIISIYRVAPGRHMAFMQWMANQEAAAQDAGVTAGQWYVHLNGDSWDFLAITTEAFRRTERSGRCRRPGPGAQDRPAVRDRAASVHRLAHRHVRGGADDGGELLAGAQED